MQATLKSPVAFHGAGLHSGMAARMVVRPASAEYGIWFRRTDLPDASAYIAARWDNVCSTRLCTQIANAQGSTVSTIEHVMAALAGCGIHNALVEIDGPEVPILDGSSAPFVEAFLKAGLRKLAAPLCAYRILSPIEVTEGAASARLEPSDMLEIDFQIEFAGTIIGAQSKRLNMANGAFVRELSDSRTFCLQRDVDAMRLNGLALGGSLENAVVIDGDQVVNPGGFRHRDEAVRHKMLDAMGDLALAGAPILGRYIGKRSGHGLTNRLIRAMFAAPHCYRLVDIAESASTHLPGAGVSRADIRTFA